MNQNKCLYNYQFHFQNHHSMNHALITIKDKIQNSLDDGKYACDIFLDLQKAIDTVKHKINLSKLEHYEMQGIPFILSKLLNKLNSIC